MNRPHVSVNVGDAERYCLLSAVYFPFHTPKRTSALLISLFRLRPPDLIMEISLLIVLDLREQAALQAALMTHGAPDALVTLALTGACRIQSLDEARQLRRWLAETRASGKTDFASLNVIERELVRFGV